MEKYKFNAEYEFRASPKVIYPYISTASGLQQWFAAKAITKGDSTSFDFIWDNESHPAKLTVQKLNKMTRFDFQSESQKGNYVEFKIEVSELTSTTFFKITDCSDNKDPQDLDELWEAMVDKLKDILGS